MSQATYDLLIIGAGPGGYVAAIRAAQLGMRVACIEKEGTLGGTCLNVGCIPSKALLDSSERYHAVRNGMTAHGIRVGQIELDLAAMMARKDKVVTVLTRGVVSLFKKNKIDWLRGTATLTSPDTVAVHGQDNVEVRAARVLIATGSAPIELPGLPFDGRHIVSSTEALALRQVPGRLLVVGAGAVGLEMASVWSRLGSAVCVVEFMDRIVPWADAEMATALQRTLQKQGIAFRLGTTAREAKPADGLLRVALATEDRQSEEICDLVLVAVGRRPYTTGLGLDRLGVQTDAGGRIRVDECFQTNVRGVFAVGDVIPGPMLAHKASEEGVAAVEMMAGVSRRVGYDDMPNIVYTWPELASVGMTEQQATASGRPFRVGSFPFQANGRARCMNETGGSIKVIADADSDRLLGIHVLGAGASELIAEAALAVQLASSASDIAHAIHAHPTLAEALKEASLAVAGRALHI